MFKPQRPEDASSQGASLTSRETATRTGGSGGRSTIAADMKVVGNLVSKGELQIDGEIDGDIKAAAVTVGRGATVSGSILADRVDVHGTVKGQIDGATVSLSANARIEGDVVHDSLAVEAGAYLNGHCRRRNSKPANVGAGATAASSPAAAPSATAPAVNPQSGSAQGSGAQGSSGQSAGGPAKN